MSSLLVNRVFTPSVRLVTNVQRASLSTSVRLLNKQTAYQNFVHLKFAEIKQQHPSLKSTDIFKKLAELYRQLTPKEKMQFQVSEAPEPEPSVGVYSEKQKSLMYAHRHGMPRKPPVSGLNVYIREKLSGLKGIPMGKVAIMLREAVKDWNSLSEADRQTYGAKALELKAAYEKDLQTWATEHNLRFTKNLTILTQRFYEQGRKSKNDDRASAQITQPVKSTTRKPRSRSKSGPRVS